MYQCKGRQIVRRKCKINAFSKGKIIENLTKFTETLTKSTENHRKPTDNLNPTYQPHKATSQQKPDMRQKQKILKNTDNINNINNINNIENIKNIKNLGN